MPAINQHDPDTLAPIDLLLGEGTAAERLALLRRSRCDPPLARELRETAHLLLLLRELVAPPAVVAEESNATG